MTGPIKALGAHIKNRIKINVKFDSLLYQQNWHFSGHDLGKGILKVDKNDCHTLVKHYSLPISQPDYLQKYLAFRYGISTIQIIKSDLAYNFCFAISQKIISHFHVMFQDYNPTQDGSGEVLSEEEGSGEDEEGTGLKKPKGQKNKNKKKPRTEKLGKRTGGLFLEEADTKTEEEEDRKKEFELEKVELKEEEEKKKMDSLWAGEFTLGPFISGVTQI
jgi:hypothetical protein